MPERTVFAVASAKGGVGKTTTSINLATALAARGLDAVVVELDLAMANVIDFLSLPLCAGTDPTMHDVLADEAAVEDALYEAPGGATVAPSGTALDGLDDVDVGRLPAVVSALDDRFDRVVLDTGAGLNTATTTAIGLADATILVSTPRVASIRDTVKTRTLVDREGGDVRGVVLTKTGTGGSPGPDPISEFLDVDLLCSVPDDAAVPDSQDCGEPVVERRPDSAAACAYVEGAGVLAGEPPTDGADAPTGPSEDRPPSREVLEAQGWTFPAAAEPGSAAEPAETAVDSRTDETASTGFVSADGGDGTTGDSASPDDRGPTPAAPADDGTDDNGADDDSERPHEDRSAELPETGDEDGEENERSVVDRVRASFGR